MESIIALHGLELTVVYDYEPEDKQIAHYADGSGGYDGAPAKIDIREVYVGEYDIYELVSFSMEETIKDIIKESL